MKEGIFDLDERAPPLPAAVSLIHPCHLRGRLLRTEQRNLSRSHNRTDLPRVPHGATRVTSPPSDGLATAWKDARLPFRPTDVERGAGWK
jgi:hypothetical protein